MHELTFEEDQRPMLSNWQGIRSKEGSNPSQQGKSDVKSRTFDGFRQRQYFRKWEEKAGMT